MKVVLPIKKEDKKVGVRPTKGKENLKSLKPDVPPESRWQAALFLNERSEVSVLHRRNNGVFVKKKLDFPWYRKIKE